MMWIASKLGFYSIVKKDRDEWHVRARVQSDLYRLTKKAAIRVEVETWPEADYRYRVIVSRRQLSKIFHALNGSIDYPNFKSRIASMSDQREKLDAYHSVWSELAALQKN